MKFVLVLSDSMHRTAGLVWTKELWRSVKSCFKVISNVNVISAGTIQCYHIVLFKVYLCGNGLLIV